MLVCMSVKAKFIVELVCARVRVYMCVSVCARACVLRERERAFTQGIIFQALALSYLTNLFLPIREMVYGCFTCCVS